MDPLILFGWSGILARLGGAVAIGSLLGINRELQGKPAGLRTNSLVALSAALVTLGIIAAASGPGLPDTHHADSLSRVIQGILTGVGFVGAGVILRDSRSTHVHGLTTAATIWMSAVLGILCGAGYWAPALVGTVLTLAILIFGGPFEKFVHVRFPRLTEEDEDRDFDVRR